MGHVFLVDEKSKLGERIKVRSNVVNLLGLFRVKTLPQARVQLSLDGIVHETTTEFDGFFKFDFRSEPNDFRGWREIRVALLDAKGQEICASEGSLYYPNRSQYAYISDIDDTIMKSFSATIFKRLYELVSRSAAKRRLFDNTSKFYNALSESNTEEGVPNPFFYVSSSEWNLYDYLNTVFREHKLPRGVFLLNTIRTLGSFLQTGKKGHEGKLFRIARIILAFPENKFILIGDNSQKDPEIYAAIAEKYPEQIAFVLIRNVHAEHESSTRAFLKNIEHLGVSTCFFKTTQEAIAYSRKVGLIHDRTPASAMNG